MGNDQSVQKNQTAVTLVRNPATGEEITSVPSLSEPEVDAAIARAAAAFAAWRDVAPGDRARLLRRFAAPWTPTARSWPGSRWPTPAT